MWSLQVVTDMTEVTGAMQAVTAVITADLDRLGAKATGCVMDI